MVNRKPFKRLKYVYAPIATIVLIIVAIFVYGLYINKITPNPLALETHKFLFSSIITITMGASIAIITSVGVFWTVKSIKLTYKSIEASTESAKKQATIDLVMDLNSDERLQETKNLMFLKGDELTQYYINLGSPPMVCSKCEKSEQEPQEPQEPQEDSKDIVLKKEKLKDNLHYVLNRYEFISLGIRKEAFDEELLKYLQCTNMLKLYEYTKPLIMEIRKIDQTNTLFQEFVTLMDMWKNDPITEI